MLGKGLQGGGSKLTKPRLFIRVLYEQCNALEGIFIPGGLEE